MVDVFGGRKMDEDFQLLGLQSLLFLDWVKAQEALHLPSILQLVFSHVHSDYLSLYTWNLLHLNSLPFLHNSPVSLHTVYLHLDRKPVSLQVWLFRTALCPSFSFLVCAEIKLNHRTASMLLGAPDY